MKLLFIHNTIPEYREQLFIKLSQKIDVDFLFTKINLNKKIYGMDVDLDIDKYINIKFLSTGIKRYKELLSYVGNKEYDYVIIPPLDSFRDFIDGILILVKAKSKQKKLLYFGEKWEAPIDKQPKIKKIKNFLQRCAFKFILKKIDMCIASGHKSSEYLKKIGIKENKITIAIDSSGVSNTNIKYNIRQKYNIKKDSKIILYYGRIVERKGLDILIKAYEKIYRKIGDVYLLICGDGPFRLACEAMSNNLNLENVIFEGFVEPDSKYTYFSQVDIFVLPSYFYKGIPEAWGLTVNEALQCGKPVIATEAVGAAYDLINGKNGEMIKENDVEEMASSLEKFIVDKRNVNTSEECVMTYKKYDYDNMARCFVKALKRA